MATDTNTTQSPDSDESVHPTEEFSSPQTAPDQDAAAWYKEEDEAKQPTVIDESPEEFAPQVHVQVEWTASEYVEHEKSSGWFLLVGVIAVVIAALVFFVTRSIVTTVLLLAMFVIFGVAAKRKPRELHYRLDNKGLTIGQKMYHYDQFRSFSVVKEGAFSSILLIPLKRFMPPISVYYSPQDEDKIVEALSAELPVEPHKPDVMDAITRKMRF
jgi:hypothetical protein